MSKRFYPIMGGLIFLIPFLGIPGSYRHVIVSALGLAILVYSMWPVISAKITSKPKMMPTVDSNIKIKPSNPNE